MMRRNPFSTRFTRPGEIPFVFPAGNSLETIIEAFQQPGAQGAIVGPHGSGKSTLLETLSEHWRKHGLVEQRVRLTASRKRETIPLSELDANSLLVIDGFEQLLYWKQRWIRWRCQQKRARLLVTTHGDCGLPVALRTQPDWALAYQLSSMLLACDVMAYEADLYAVWNEAPGDIRAYFFRLYHWCELHGIYLMSGQSKGAQGLPV
ncbi:hypothetical protein C5Y96_01610 [Blastopirellula marina]|uniref:AAA+ ATPase domain-containing protein n=1 Tax=Blastopirellula marina TaxID=124 RepID=A0A2S8G761_9BACT|nr:MULTISPECIES: hypothetical protein [Pirellulaceae]PQO40296.1 hypothetical protein C5Y96_01610 [Blastopirellula marina]RCS55844.1 hypothetical protein DTL36_01610 [Bremerella cremea]